MFHRISIFILVATLLVMNSGCGVLTKTQVKEVNKFATAAKVYGDMPGAVIGEHAKIRRNRQLLLASTISSGETALQAIELAVSQKNELSAKAAQADASLMVLKYYAELLVTLSSDDFTNDLQASSESLASSIDKGIGQYNNVSSSKLSPFGSSVAAIVRGAGGIYIRSEQEKALKQAIVSADPIIQAMLKTVEETMALYLNKDELQKLNTSISEKDFTNLIPGSLIAEEKQEVMDKYRKTAGQYEGKQPPNLPFIVADEIEASDNAVQLAAKAILAAEAYRKAHAVLANNVVRKRDISDHLDEIQVLIEEVKAAQQLKRKLDKE